MKSLIRALIAVGQALYVPIRLFAEGGHLVAQWLVKNLVIGAIGVAGDIIKQLSPDLEPVFAQVIDAVNTAGAPIARTIRGPAEAFARAAVSDKDATLSRQGESTPDNALQAAIEAFSGAFAFGLASHGVTAGFEALFPEKLNTFNAIGPLFSSLAGFEDVTGKILEPLYDAAFGRSLQYHYRSVFKPELPDEADAVLWHSRRLLTDAQLRNIFKYSGLKDEYEGPFITSAYRAVQPFILSRLFEDSVFPRDEVQSMLEFTGIRPHDIPVLLDAFAETSTKNVRHQYLSAIITAAERGTIDDTTLDSHLDSLKFSSQAKNYVHLTISVRRLEQLAEIYRKSVTALYETGQITDDQYVPSLEAIGINRADAEAHYAVDSAKVRGKALAAAERAAAREARELLSEGIGAIKSAFMES